MSVKKIRIIDIVIILLAVLVLLLGVVLVLDLDRQSLQLREPVAVTVPETIPSTEEPTAPPTEVPTEPTEPPTEPPTDPPTEPQAQSFVITMVGDCTFGCNKGGENRKSAFPLTVGDDFGYPFRNVLEYFQNDDYSLINLEGVLGDQGTARNKKYVFRGSGDYTRIMTENSIEGVNLANNHSGDYGEEGYAETKRLLEEAGIAYVEHMNSTIVTTESGLTIALYAADGSLSPVDQEQIVADIAQLKESGAELIICAFHWGVENTFKANETQQTLGRAAIDAGAHIVWGHHPHVLQPIEEYNGGLICYSLGNFAFGGNSAPKDLDTVLLQQEVIREADGTITLGQLTKIPCSVSSVSGSNNFQPTPYETDSKLYEQVLSKLDGTYRGSNLPIG